MFRSIPISNKLCFDKELKRSWRIHEQKLRKLKGSVGKQKPQEFVFLDYRLKKNALIDVKNIEIQRQNKVLLQKMKQIETKGCKNSYFKITELSPQKKKTLNQPYRKRELIKIVEQNQQIMKRIHQKKSAYNIKKMQLERIEIEKNISLISEYPYKNYPCKNTPTNLWMTDDNFKIKNSKVSETTVRPQNLTYSGTKKINNNYYIISTYVKDKIFYIQIENLQQNNDKYRMKLQEEQIKNLLAHSYGGSFDNLIDSLEIDKQNQSCYLRYQIKSTHH